MKCTDEQGWVSQGFGVCFWVLYAALMMTAFSKSETFDNK